jgi:hypothetical protein
MAVGSHQGVELGVEAVHVRVLSDDRREERLVG